MGRTVGEYVNVFYPLTTEVSVNVTALLRPTINLRAVQANEWFSVLHAAKEN